MQQARYPTTISLINTASSNSRKNLHQWHRKIATSSVSKKPKTIAITSIITAISCPRNDILYIPNNSMYLHSLTSRHVNHYFRTMDDYRKPCAQEIQKIILRTTIPLTVTARNMSTKQHPIHPRYQVPFYNRRKQHVKQIEHQCHRQLWLVQAVPKKRKSLPGIYYRQWL